MRYLTRQKICLKLSRYLFASSSSSSIPPASFSLANVVIYNKLIMPEFSAHSPLGYLMSHYWGKIIASLSLASYLRPTADSWLLFMLLLLFILSLSCTVDELKFIKIFLFLPGLSLKWNELVWIPRISPCFVLYSKLLFFLFHIHPSHISLMHTHTHARELNKQYLHDWTILMHFFSKRRIFLILPNMLGIYYFHTCYALLFNKFSCHRVWMIE